MNRQVIARTLPLALIVWGVLAAAWWWYLRGPLWEDEIIAVTHGLQPLPTFFVQVLRNDIHPFFYFLLLKLWVAVWPQSDAWIVGSSLLSALGSAWLIGLLAARMYGRAVGWWSAAIFVALPTFAWAASNVRMYGLLPGLIVLVWYLNRGLLRGPRKWPWVLGLLAAQLAFSYSHAIAFFFMSFVLGTVLLESWRDRQPGALSVWLRVQLVWGVAVLPLAGMALLRGTEPLPRPELGNLMRFPAELMSVWGAGSGAIWAGGIVFAILLAFGLRTREGRVMSLGLPVAVLVICMVVSAVGKPMFKPPVFTACLVPFLAMAAACGVVRIGRLAPACLLGAALVICAVTTFIQRGPVSGDFDKLAREIAARTRPGDVVVVPNVSIYWGVVRYAISVHWGRPLAVMPLHPNEAWSRVFDRLGPKLEGFLGLKPATDHITAGGVTYVIGETVSKLPPADGRVWIVYRRGYKADVSLPAAGHVLTVHRLGAYISISEIGLASDGQLTFAPPTLPGTTSQ